MWIYSEYSEKISTMVFHNTVRFCERQSSMMVKPNTVINYARTSVDAIFKNVLNFQNVWTTSPERPICKPKYLHKNIFWIEFTAKIKSWTHCSAYTAALHSEHSPNTSFVWLMQCKSSRKKRRTEHERMRKRICF